MDKKDQLILDEAQVYCPRAQALIREALPKPLARAAILLLMERIKQLDMALQSLTPGGSEYVGEPERCVAYVRSRLDNEFARKVAAKRTPFVLTKPRYQILEALNHRPRSHHELRELLGMSSRGFSGAFSSSLIALVDEGLVAALDGAQDVYEITSTGRKVLA